MPLDWIKCKGDVWCNLNTVNLNHPHFNNMHGVYIIWHGGAEAATVYVGQGYVKDRLAAHRADPEIQKYANHGLYVTWAAVTPASRDGVEVYLARSLRPKVGRTYPNAEPISVNSPW